MSERISPNQREVLYAVGLSGNPEPLFSTNNALDISGSISITGGATAANQTNGNQKTQIVDPSDNSITSNSTTTVGKFGLDTNILSILGTAPTTAGFLDVKGADGNVFVRQTTAANLNATVVGTKTNNNAVPGATNIGALVGIANAAAPSYSEGDQVLLSTDLSGSMRITGSISVGGTTDNSAFTAGTSTGTTALGFYHSTIDTVTDGRAAALAIDSKRNLFTVLRDAAGNARGANVNVSNQLSVSVDNTPNIGTVTTVSAVTAISNALPAGTNVIGHVITDATSVTNATLSAETTKVIGTVRTADGAGNLLTTNSTTYTAKFGLDSNLLGTLGTAFTTAGKVDVKGADGDVFVRQTTAASLNATVVGTGTFAVQNTPAAPAAIFNGKTTVATAGTRVTLAASQAIQSVTIKALSTNTGFIYVGSSAVASTNGLQLQAGESVSMDVANLNTINIDSSVNGEGVTYLAVG